MDKDIKKSFPFTVENKEFDSLKEKRTAKSIIEEAQEKGIASAQGPIDTLTLKGETATYDLDDIVDLSQDNNFSMGVKTYKFKVNGQKLESKSEKLVASDIIKMAQNENVTLPANVAVENLLLIDGTQNKTFKPDDWVDLTQFNVFSVIKSGPTPVA